MNDALLDLVYADPLDAWADVPVLELDGPLDDRLATVLAALGQHPVKPGNQIRSSNGPCPDLRAPGKNRPAARVSATTRSWNSGSRTSADPLIGRPLSSK